MSLKPSLIGLCLCGAFVSTVVYADVPVKETEALDFAQTLLSRGMYDMAIGEYQKFITDYPQSSYVDEAHFAIAESYFQARNFAKASDAFTQFKQQYPNSPKLPKAVLRLAQMDLDQKKYEEALKELSAVDPSKVQGQDLEALYFYTARAYRGKGDTAAALTNIQKATQVTDGGPLEPYAFEELSEVQAQNGQYKDAIDGYTKALASTQDQRYKAYLIYKTGEAQFLSGNYAQAVDQFKQVLENFPSSDVVQDAFANVLLAYFNLGQYDHLLAVYKAHQDLVKDQSRAFDIHFAAARAYTESQQYDNALALLEKLLALPGLSDVQKHQVIEQKADVLIRAKRFQDAVALLDGMPAATQAADADKDVFLKAQAFYGAGDFKKAHDFFQNLISTYPQSTYIKASLLGLANCSQQLGDHQEASDDFTKYYNAETDPDLKGQALYDAALMAVELKDSNKAIEQLEQYLRDFPKGKYAQQSMLLLADLYSKNKQPDKAVALLKDYAAHPENTQRPDEAFFLLGYSQQLSGQSAQALETYKKVPLNRSDPKFYAWALKNSAVIYLGQKNDAQAAQLFKQAGDLDQNYLDFKTYLWVCNEFLNEHQYKNVLSMAENARRFFPDQGKEEIPYFVAEAYRGLKDFSNADKFYDEVLASKAKDSYTGSAHIGKGLYLAELHKFDQAKAEFEKALDENADDNTITVRARFELGNIARQQNDLNTALRFYLLVATLYADDYYCPESLLRAGQVFEQLKRNDQALENYREILAKYKNSPQAAQAQKRMDALK